MISKKFEPDVVERQKNLWKRRDHVVATTDMKKMVNRNILQRCTNEIKAMEKEVKIDREAIISRFLQERDRKMKKKSKGTNGDGDGDDH